MVGLLEGATKEQKGVANLHIMSDDIMDWYESSIGDERNPVIIKKKLEKMWDWSLYVLEYQEIERINGSNKTREVKDQEIKRLKEAISKEEFPTLERLAGAKKIIKKRKEAEKKLAEYPELSNVVTTEPIKVEAKKKVEPKKVEAKKKTKSKSTKPTSKSNNNIPRTEAEKKRLEDQVKWERENIIDPAKNVFNSIIKYFD